MRKKPTVLGVMVLIAYIAIGLAGIRSSEWHLAAAMLWLTVFGLCTATLIAIEQRGPWAGFSVFGWACFLVCRPHDVALSLTFTQEIIFRLYLERDAMGFVPNASLVCGLSLSCIAAGLLGALLCSLLGYHGNNQSAAADK